MADLKRYLTNPSLIAEGFFRQISSYSVFQNKSEFKVRVLSTPQHYAGPDYEASVSGDTEPSSKWWFKGRITDINMPHEKFLPDPCDESIAADKNLVKALVAMHSTVFSEGKPECDVGDIISAFIEPGDNNMVYNVQNLKYLKVETQVVGGLKAGDECFSLSTMFDNDEGANGSSATPLGSSTRDDPTFSSGKCQTQTYPSLTKKQTIFSKYTEEETIAAIQDSGQPANIQRIMFLIISHEQPNYRFPNNNVAGIQLDSTDGFRGTTEADFDYQTCYLDSGDEWRVFAGFNDLEHGMQVFGSIVAAKATSKSWHTSDSLTGEQMAENYYNGWNTAATPAEIASLKTTGKFTRDGKEYPILGTFFDTTTKFNTSIREWNLIP